MNKKRLFFAFLQKHNALEAYKRSLKATIGNVRTRDYIPLGGSFVWAHTPEGHEYWQALDMQWEHYFESIEKKYHF